MENNLNWICKQDVLHFIYWVNKIQPVKVCWISVCEMLLSSIAKQWVFKPMILASTVQWLWGIKPILKLVQGLACNGKIYFKQNLSHNICIGVVRQILMTVLFRGVCHHDNLLWSEPENGLLHHPDLHPLQHDCSAVLGFLLDQQRCCACPNIFR